MTLRYLHAERPGGLHVWHPIPEPCAERIHDVVARLAPHMPADTVWDVTTTTMPPEPQPEEPTDEQ